MERKTIAIGLAGLAAVGAAAMMLRPREDKRVKKALKTVGAAADTISRMLG